jgi:hypothetical protein
VRYQVSHPCKTTGRIMVLWILTIYAYVKGISLQDDWEAYGLTLHLREITYCTLSIVLLTWTQFVPEKTLYKHLEKLGFGNWICFRHQEWLGLWWRIKNRHSLTWLKIILKP